MGLNEKLLLFIIIVCTFFRFRPLHMVTSSAKASLHHYTLHSLVVSYIVLFKEEKKAALND